MTEIEGGVRSYALVGDDGRLLGRVACRPEDLESNTRAGEHAVPGLPPDPLCIWNGEGWDQPAETALLDRAKVAARDALAVVATEKLSRWTGGTAPAGGLQVDDVSTGRITSWATQAVIAQTAGVPLGLPYWIMDDNSRYAISGPAAFIAFAQAALAYKTQAVLRNSVLKLAITAAPDVAALAAIDITAGWPA